MGGGEATNLLCCCAAGAVAQECKYCVTDLHCTLLYCTVGFQLSFITNQFDLFAEYFSDLAHIYDSRYMAQSGLVGTIVDNLKL